MKNFKKLLIFLLIFLLLPLYGCWDLKEIQQRAFIFAIGYDKYEMGEPLAKETKPQQEAEKKGEEGEVSKAGQKNHQIPESANEQYRWLVTIAFPNVKKFGAQGGGGGGDQETARFVVTTVGIRGHEAVRELNTRLNKFVDFGHTQAVIIGEEYAKDKDLFKELMDGLEREKSMKRKVRMVVVKDGRAQDLMHLKTIFEPVYGSYIRGIFSMASNNILTPVEDVNTILRELHESDGNTLIPKITYGENDFKISGYAVIKDYHLIGWTEDIETRPIRILRNNVGAGIMTVDVQGIQVPFDITLLKTSKKVVVEGDKITMLVKIKSEGNIIGHSMGIIGEVFDTKYIETVQKALEEKIKKEVTDVILKFQNQYKVDAFGFGDYIKKFKPDLWEKVKEDWDDKGFPNLDIRVEVNAKIRNIGLVR